AWIELMRCRARHVGGDAADIHHGIGIEPYSGTRSVKTDGARGIDLQLRAIGVELYGCLGIELDFTRCREGRFLKRLSEGLRHLLSGGPGIVDIRIAKESRAYAEADERAHGSKTG